MTLPKNSLTTNRLARAARHIYRDTIRPVAWDVGGQLRQRRRPDRSNPPAFLIVGVQKAGTTSLFDGLMVDPHCGLPPRKEIHYFDGFPQRDERWYYSHFWGDPGRVWGEATPEYFDTAGIETRVHRLLPDARIFISLRDPVKRTISHYHHARDFGYEHRPLDVAIREERAELARGRTDTPLARAYLRRSMYSSRLEAWLARYPREQVTIVLAEQPRTALETARAVLGLDATPEVAGVATPASNQRPYDAPSVDVISAIAEVVTEDIQRTSDVAGWARTPEEWAAWR
jgi:hypothetical protein